MVWTFGRYHESTNVLITKAYSHHPLHRRRLWFKTIGGNAVRLTWHLETRHIGSVSTIGVATRLMHTPLSSKLFINARNPLSLLWPGPVDVFPYKFVIIPSSWLHERVWLVVTGDSACFNSLGLTWLAASFSSFEVVLTTPLPTPGHSGEHHLVWRGLVACLGCMPAHHGIKHVV